MLGLLLSGVVYSAANGIWPSLYAEMFETHIRLSGMAISTQIGFAPGIASGLQCPGQDGWVPVAVFVMFTCAIAAVSIMTARETYRTPMHELGKRRPAAARVRTA